MYESHIVSQFFREWGFRDGLAAAKNHPNGGIENVSMLGNMQNKFDAVFGDVALTRRTRFQLIEFKQEAKGFEVEVRQGKKNRAALFEHLQIDKPCLILSLQGHVAGYVENNVLKLDPYYVICTGKYSHVISQRFPTFFNDFNSYYKLWNALPVNGQLNVGLDSDQFKEYVACMYQHLDTDAKGVLLIFSEKKNAPVPFYGSIKELVDDLLLAFTNLEKIVTQASRPSGP